jgi:hypothetical protein
MTPDETIINNEPVVEQVIDQPTPVEPRNPTPVPTPEPVIVERVQPVVVDDILAPGVQPVEPTAMRVDDPLRAAMKQADNTPAPVSQAAYVDNGPGKYRLEYTYRGEKFVETFDTVPLVVNRTQALERAGINAVPYTAE